MKRFLFFSLLLAAFSAGRVSAQSILTIAGGGTDDGRPATLASLNRPLDVALDAAGNAYIADWENHRIRKVSAATGIITTVAGNGTEGNSGDGGPATEAAIDEPSSVAVDAAGNLYIADMGNYRIRKVDARTAVIATIAGGGFATPGDGGLATAANLGFITSVRHSRSGDLYFVEASRNKVRKISLSTGILTTVAGSGNYGFSGDGGPATAASFQLSGDRPGAIVIGSSAHMAIDDSGNIYISDTYSHRVRRVDAGGTITTIAGTGTASYSGDGGPATSATIDHPTGIVMDPAGDIVVSDARNYRIRRISRGSGTITTIAGSGPGFGGDGGPALGARVLGVGGLAYSTSGDLFFADQYNGRLRKIAAVSSIVSTVAGAGVLFSGDGGPATSGAVHGPAAIAIDSTGAIIISEYNADRIRRLAPDGKISTIAGTGHLGSGSGNGLPATQVSLFNPGGVAVDAAGNVYFADLGNDEIRRVTTANGILNAVAGTGTRGFAGDGGPATAALLNLSSPDPASSLHIGFPSGTAIASSGDLYFADTFNQRIRRVAAGTQIISTIAGNGTAGYSGDGGPATSAQFDRPTGIALDRANNLFVADTYNNRVRKIDLINGTITTVAGSGATNGVVAFGGDGGPATAARIASPTGVSVDATGNLFMADKLNHRIRKVAAGSGIITTIAGSRSNASYFGDGGPAVQAGLSTPYGVYVDSNNTLYIADTEANRLRVIANCVSIGAARLVAPASGASGLGSAPALSWERVSGAFRYDVYLSTTNPPALVATDVTSTTFTPSNLDPGSTYYWKIVAKGDPFCSPLATGTSEIRSFSTTAGCTAPGGFGLSQPGDGATGVGSSTTLSWAAAPGAGTYDLYFGPTTPPAFYAAGLTTTSQNVSGIRPNTTYSWQVVAHASCDATKTASSPTRSFVTSGSCGGAGSFALQSPSNGATNVPLTATLSWSASANASSYDLYFGTSTSPPVYLTDLQRTSIAIAGLAPSQNYWWKVVAKVACDSSKNVSSAVSSFTAAGGCVTPATPAITFVPPGNVGVGQTYSIAWKELPELDAEGFYLVERSTSGGFNAILDTQRTFSTSASFMSSTSGTYYHRVRAARGCDLERPGAYSEAKSVNVVTGTANVIFTVQPQAVITSLGDKLEDRRARFTLENLGASALQVVLGKGEINSVPFFSITDPAGGDSVFVTLEPRKPKSFEIQFSGPRNDQASAYQGIVFVAATGQGLAITPYAFVNLKVGGAATSRPQFIADGRPTEYAFFPGLGGDDTNRPSITVEIRNNGSAPMELGAEIGPEVWLVSESGWNSSPIPAGATRAVRLRTQRSRAPNGSALPRYTYFTVRSKNGETARLLVQDNDALSTTSGRTSLLDPGSRSFIVPGIVSTTSSYSKLRITNVGSDPVQTDLFFTRLGADGLNASNVRRATIVVPPNDVVTLTDPIAQVFGLPGPLEGHLEVRAAPEKVGFLIVGSTVIAPISTGGAFTYEVPTLLLGEGARIGKPHMIAGVTASSNTRATLILAETSGTEATRVRAVLYDAGGARKGDRSVDVPRYGLASVDNVVSSLGGSEPFTGRIDIEIESGGGSVAGIVRMLDAAQGSGALAISQPSSGGVSGNAFARLRQYVGPAVDVPLATAVVPVVVNGPLPGQAGTNQRTTLGFTLATGTSKAVPVTYRSAAPGAAPIEKVVNLSPHVVLQFENVLEQLFGIPAGQAATGSIFVNAGKGAQLFARLMTSTGGQWKMAANLPIVPTLSDIVSSLASKRPLYLDGLEQSIDSTRGTRWAVVVNELGGATGSVMVRLYEAGNRGMPIAEKRYDLAAYQRLELDSVFAALGLDSDERRKDRTNVLCVVVAESGRASISAVGIARDNRTADARHFVFSPTGGMPSTGVLRISLVTPVTPTTPPPPPTTGGGRRRIVKP